MKLRVCELGPMSAYGKTWSPRILSVKVPVNTGMLKLVQDQEYTAALRKSGAFDASFIEYPSTGELFRLGKMPPQPNPNTTAFSRAVSSEIVARHSDNLIVATSGNEAPIHPAQVTYCEETSIDPLRSRELLGGKNIENEGMLYALVYSKSEGLVFRIIQVRQEGGRFAVYQSGHNRINDYAVIVTGKPLIWFGQALSIAKQLRYHVGDVRHMFRLPEVNGYPVGMSAINRYIRKGSEEKVEGFFRRGKPLLLSLSAEQARMEKLGLPSDLLKIREAFETDLDHWRMQDGDTVELPLALNPYRYTFWARTGGNEIIAGIVSNNSPDPKNAVMGSPLPQLQDYLLRQGAREAMVTCGGKDNRLYTAEGNYSDPDSRPSTPSGTLLLIKK